MPTTSESFSCKTGAHPLQLGDEEVDHGFHLQSFGRKQYEHLIGQIELQHVIGRDCDKHNVRVTEGRNKNKANRHMIKKVCRVHYVTPDGSPSNVTAADYEPLKSNILN